MSESLALDAEAVHGWFGLSYANYAVLPRTLLQSMPEDWQCQFVALMDVFDTTWANLPDGFLPRGYRVQPTVGGKLVSWNEFRLPHYSRGRARVQSDGTITGERFPR